MYSTSTENQTFSCFSQSIPDGLSILFRLRIYIYPRNIGLIKYVMKIGSYGYVKLDFMTRRPHDDIFTETYSYETFSPSIYDIELMFFHTHIHWSIRNIVYIMLVTNWWSKGVVKYEYVMTMGCAAQESILAKSITVLVEQYPVCHQQRDAGTLRKNPGICIDC